MNEIQWYYARDDQRFGPVSTVELKRLAERGQLGPADLVWREGMADWVAASQVKGLFHASASESSSQVEPVESSPSIQPQAPAVQPVAAKPKAPMRHPVEVVLSKARAIATEGFVDSSVRMFVLLGHYALYATMLLVLIAGTVVSIQLKSFIPFVLAIAIVPMLAVLQYAAGQFCAALDRVNRSTRATVVSTTLVDLIGLVSLVLGPVLLLFLAAQAVMTSVWTLVLMALLAFIVVEHLAAVALVRVDSGVIVSDQLTPGEEALGTLCALLKMFARVVPVAFGAGVSCGTIVLAVLCIQCLQSSGSEALVVNGIMTLSQTGTVALFAALPMIGYLAFIIGALFIDILDGLLTLRRAEEE